MQDNHTFLNVKHLFKDPLKILKPFDFLVLFYFLPNAPQIFFKLFFCKNFSPLIILNYL